MINYTSGGEWIDPREIVNPQRNYRQQAVSKKPILKKSPVRSPRQWGLTVPAVNKGRGNEAISDSSRMTI
jgi:hypothetical protein